MDPTTGIDAEPPLLEKLHGQVGDGLRSVTRYRDRSYEVSYLHEALDSLYTEEQLDAIFEDLVLQGLHKDRLEGLFQTGELECSIFKFEDALMFHFTPGRADGLFVTIDPGTEVDIESLAATCRQHM